MDAKADFDRFADRFEDLAKYYQVQKIEGFNIVRECERYWQHLKPYTVESVLQALEVIEAHAKWWPRVSEIIQVITGGSAAPPHMKRKPQTPEEKKQTVAAIKQMFRNYPHIALLVYGHSADGFKKDGGFVTTRCLEGIDSNKIVDECESERENGGNLPF